MPALEMWNAKKGDDYRFFDNAIKEQFDVMGLAVNIHKYIGPDTAGSDADDPSEESGDGVNELTVADMLFLSNRDSKFEKDLYELKGFYAESDNPFDLSQFGLLMPGDMIQMTFHLNHMVSVIGRKLMNRDVVELPNLIDEFPLDAGAAPIPKFYKVEDGIRPSEGFSMTWWPHMWQVKLTPITDSREFKPILDADYNGAGPLRELISVHSREMEISDASREAAEKNNPDGDPDDGHIYNRRGRGGVPLYFDELTDSQRGDEFPREAKEGALFLREDYDPHVLYRREGSRWVRISHRKATWEERTFPGAAATNNAGTTVIGGEEIAQRQSVTDAVRPRGK